jgi:RNA polymerase primary sigma factor
MRQLKITQKITKKDSIVLEKYLNDIGKISMIDAKEEGRLAKLIREGSQEALERITTANLRFVISVAKQYQNKGMPLEDLINEGNLGLIKAAKRFDESKGYKFISYAVWWIRQSILQAIVEYSRIVRLPLNKVGCHNKVNEAYLRLLQRLEREPTIREISEEINLKPADVFCVFKNNGKHVSIDAPISIDEENDVMTLMDTLVCHENEVPETKLVKDSLFPELKMGLKILNDRELKVIKAYYGLSGKQPMTLEEIGQSCSLTRERVRQIKERALRRLRSCSNAEELRSFL